MCEADFCCDEGAWLAAHDNYERHGNEFRTVPKSKTTLGEKERLKQRVCNQRNEIAALQEKLTEKDEEIERLMDNLQKQDDAALAELQRRKNKITQLKYEISRVTAERDAAIKDVHKAATGQYCEICDHDCIGRYFEFAACSDFKYCSLQKEDDGNDD